MNLKNIADNTLIQSTESLVREEREILTAVLYHLREIDRRRLFSSLKYKSLYEFAVKHLGYPEDQAYRRIAAMRLLNEVPEIEERINQGEISLTHINLAQSLFRQEKKTTSREMSHEQKLDVINQIANKSVREAAKITLSLSSAPEMVKPDRVRSVTENQIELKFIASIELREKIERLKGLLAHTHPNISLGELFDILCDLGLNELNPTKTAAPRKRRVISKASKAQQTREVFTRANKQCQNCGSLYALEIDHIVPKAKGGSSETDNLRVLCRNCNQRAAIIEFGVEKMDNYIN
jgi:hypothetical protein